MRDKKTKKKRSADTAKCGQSTIKPEKTVKSVRLVQEERRQERAILSSISQALSRFSPGEDPVAILENILGDILSITESEYGFIGEICRTPEDRPSIKTVAIVNFRWDGKEPGPHDGITAQGMEFYNLKNLLGEVIRTEKPVTSTNAAKDRRRGGLPEGHPPLNSFTGLPLRSGERLIGMVGLANRNGGYDRTLLTSLRPLLLTIARIMDTHGITKRPEARRVAADTPALLQSVVDGVEDPFMVIDREFSVTLMNRAARDFFRLPAETPETLHCYWLSHKKDRPCSPDAGHSCPHEEVLRTGEKVSTVHRHYDRNNDPRYVEITSLPLRDTGGEVKGITQSFRDITERRRLEEALADSEARFRKIFEDAAIGVVLVDEEGRVYDANPAYYGMLGYTREELLGMNIREFTHPDDAPKDKASLKELVEGRLGRYQTEKRYVHKDGRVIWGSLSASMLKGREGDPQLAIGVVEDITARKHAEDALREAVRNAGAEKAKTEAIITAVGDGISMQDTDFKVLYQNEAHKNLKGDQVGRYCYEAYDGRDSVCEGCPVALSFEDGEIHIAQRTGRTPKGELLVEITASPLRDSSGKIIAGVEVVRDITKQKWMEEALKAREAQLHTLIEAMPDCVVLKDPQGRHLLINRACEETFGLRGEDVLGKTVEAFFPPDLAGYCRRSDEEALKAGRPLVFEERAHGKDGTELIFETLKAAVCDDKGKTLGLVAVSRDITERKRMEDALRQSLADKDMLIKEVHHRVKNNLAVISSLLRLQTRELDDEKTRNILIESRDRVSAMSLIHEKLYRAKDVKRIHFKEYIRELAVHLFRTYEAGEHITLTVDIPDTVLDIDTVIPCGLIVNELVSNALKYAFPEGESGEISIRFRPEGEGWYTLEVKDNGVGFPEGVDFREVGSLGMQIVTSLASQLEGTADMERDGGTVFNIRLRDRGFVKDSSP